MRIPAFVFLLILSGQYCKAQGENKHWAFGWHCGLDFNSNPPTWAKTAMETSEGCAALSNSAGDLLFYTTGNYIIDRNLDTMPHSRGLLGNTGGVALLGSALQGVTLVQAIGDTNRYFLFTVDCVEAINATYPGYLRYSVIDMRLNNGRGDVDTNYKNVVLDSFTSEKMYVTHGAGCYDWLISHRYGSADFVAFKIDINGVDPAPVISPSSLGVDTSTWLSYMSGELKISQDGKMIANMEPRSGLLELSSFDNASGIVSNTRILDTLYVDTGTAAAIGLSFSPDNSKLYASPWYRFFVQYDLNILPDIAAVRDSRSVLGDSGIYKAMRLGPDNKLYIIYEDDHSQAVSDICCINKPGLRGQLCAPSVLRTPIGKDMDPRLSLGSPVTTNYRHSSKLIDTSFCLGQPVTFSAPAGYDSYLWDNGDTMPSRDFDNTVTAWVYADAMCSSEIDTFKILVQNCSCIVSIPTAFSPNGDGKNDRFSVITADLQSFHMEIYNRWGQAVFYTSVIGHSWDGTFNGIPCDGDTYYYYLKLKCIKGEEVFRKGDITLLR